MLKLMHCMMLTWRHTYTQAHYDGRQCHLSFSVIQTELENLANLPNDGYQ